MARKNVKEGTGQKNIDRKDTGNDNKTEQQSQETEQKHNTIEEDGAIANSNSDSCGLLSKLDVKIDLPAVTWIPGVILISVYLLFHHYFPCCHSHTNQQHDMGHHHSEHEHQQSHDSDHHHCHHHHQDKLDEYFDWVPGPSAKIDDPVDDTEYPYNTLKTFQPVVTITDNRQIHPIELKHVKISKGSSVRVYIIDDLLSGEECNSLMSVHDQHIESSSKQDPFICFDTVDTLQHHLKKLNKTKEVKISKDLFIKNTKCVNEELSSKLKSWGLSWSHGTGFYYKENLFSVDLSKRIEQVTGLSEQNGGPFRVVSYPENTGYKLHTDCSLDPGKVFDRFGTVLVYLNDTEIGGETYFPELGISVKPKKGRALVWNSMSTDGKCDKSSLHAAEPVIKGKKYILQRWYYYQNFPGLAQRPPVPPIPSREPQQMHVKCDYYKYGDCRWYDTWTYDLLLDY